MWVAVTVDRVPQTHWTETGYAGHPVNEMYRIQRSGYAFLWHEIEDAHK